MIVLIFHEVEELEPKTDHTTKFITNIFSSNLILEQKRLPFTRKRQKLSHKTNQMK
jgi:hypothetical protein